MLYSIEEKMLIASLASNLDFDSKFLSGLELDDGGTMTRFLRTEP